MASKRGKELQLLAKEVRKELGIKDDEHTEYDLDLYLEDMGKEIIPVKNLKSDFGIDSFWTNGFESLIIDQDCYHANNYRSRFTIAHEIGHLFMHKDGEKDYSSVEDWKELIKNEAPVRNMYEQEANGFASFFLITDECLIKEILMLKQKEEVKVYLNQNVHTLEEVTKMYSHVLAAAFHVSQQVMEIRLENYWR